MGLMIKGEFTPEEIAFVENLGPKDFWTVVNLPEEAETYGAQPSAYYERGNRAIGSAISLLKLLEPIKGKQLENLTEEIMQPENEVEEAVYQMKQENIKRIYELIKEMPKEMPKLYDDDFVLLSQYEEAVEKIDRTLYHLSIEGKKKMIDLSTGQVKQLIKFLELAIKKQHDIWLSY